MKQVIMRPCQVRYPSGKVIFHSRGDVIDIPDLHTHAEALVKHRKVNFAIAKHDELMESEIDLDELKEFASKNYNANIKAVKKEIVIKRFLDARYRSMDLPAGPIDAQ